MTRALLAMLVLAACGDPAQFALKFRVTNGDVQACTTSAGAKATTCSDVTMLCNAAVSIRVFAPSDPSAPFISVCRPLLGTGKNNNLCSIASVDLPVPAMKTKLQELEVDIVVYRAKDLQPDGNGGYICPTDVTFGADGFPTPSEPCVDPNPANCPAAPAIGGRAFYHPGDTETVVSLGCTDLAPLEDPTCTGQTLLTVTSSINDFDTGVSVSPTTADNLTVSVGEPTFDSALMAYKLPSVDTHPLGLMQGPVPSWSGSFDLTLSSSACIEVFEDGAQTTAALSCTNMIGANPLDVPGVRLAKPTLDGVLAALGNQPFPVQGLVVGKVLDYLGNPKAGVGVLPFPLGPHILYMSDDGTNFGAPATSSRGIWISTDAPYGTTFAPTGATTSSQGFGGLVAGKVDVIVIQLDPPTTGP